MSKGILSAGERAHPGFFWGGAAAVTAGVLLHLPMYIRSAAMNFHVAGMPVDNEMLAGMALIGAGTAAAYYGLLPASLRRERPSAIAREAAVFAAEAPANGEGKLTRAHWQLLLV